MSASERAIRARERRLARREQQQSNLAFLIAVLVAPFGVFVLAVGAIGGWLASR